MSFLGDALKFDKFALKDMWGKIKDDPERLLVGAVDPWSTKMWNKALGKDYEPLVDQMGGPYGGHTVSAFGNQDGGVYKRAQDAGMDTSEGGTMHDIAHVIAAFYGGQALGGAAAGGGSTGGIATTSEATGFGVGQGGAAGFNGGLGGGMSGGYGYGAAAAGGAGAGGTNWAQYAQLASSANQPTPAPAYGALPKPQTQGPFRDTFKEGQETRRRKRIAQSLMMRGRR